jgi:signal transduction histidine kinase
MTSIRRTLLAWLLLGLATVAVLATFATYVETRREIGELFDLQLKQLAYSTQIDDLLGGRAPSRLPRDGRRNAGVSEIVTQIWDRDGVLVYWSQPGAGLPVPVTEGYSDVTRDGRAWRVYTHVSGGHALQVAHALDERREIAAQAALRTPLAALALQVDFAARAADAPARAAAMAELRAGVARAARLVEQLLTMARLEPEAQARNFSRVDLGALANDAIVALAPIAEARGIDLGRTGVATVEISGDSANIATLLANLLDNALRHTPAGGRVDVAVTGEPDGAVLAVTDTGPGIPLAERERVFERFHRVLHADDAAHGMGSSGLGLSIVRRIADAHGASVTLDEGPGGKGLVVQVRFPRYDRR